MSSFSSFKLQKIVTTIDSQSISVNQNSSSFSSSDNIHEWVHMPIQAPYIGAAYYRSSGSWVESSSDNFNTNNVIGIVEDYVSVGTGSYVKLVFKGKISYEGIIRFKGEKIYSSFLSMSLNDGNAYYLASADNLPFNKGYDLVRNLSDFTQPFSNLVSIATSNIEAIIVNSLGDVVPPSLSLWISSIPPFPAPSIFNTSSISVYCNNNFDYNIQTSYWPDYYSASNLPPFLHLNTASGNIHGFIENITSSLAYTSSIFAYNLAGSASAILDISVIPAPIVTSYTASISHSTYFSYYITATNNPTVYYVSNLPNGFNFNTSTGQISGSTDEYFLDNQHGIGIFAGNPAGIGTGVLSLTIL